jgi:hypothetical protein
MKRFSSVAPSVCLASDPLDLDALPAFAFKAH